MKRLFNGLAVGIAATLTLAGAVVADDRARVVVSFDMEADGTAEGVAVDWNGDVFTGLSAQGRMLMIPGGEGEAQEVMALDGLAEGDFGFVGHAFNSDGWLYSAVVSSNPELSGLVAIDPDTGDWRHVAGTEKMAMANALETDGWGGLWVSDTILGAVWRVFPADFPPLVEMWVQDPLLEGTGELPYPFPIGANGIDVASNTVYIANTERSTIVGIPITHEGTAGEPFVHAELPGVSADGIAFDVAGNLYVADPPAHTLWRVTPEGEISAVADVDDGFSGPSSVALHEDEDGLVAYVSNQAIGNPETIKHGPSVIAITLE